MIWLHCGSAEDAATTACLAQRFAARPDGPEVIVTAPKAALHQFQRLAEKIFATPTPTDTPSAAKGFFDEWGPRALIWVGGALQQTLLRETERVGLWAALLNANADGLFGRRTLRLPGSTRKAVAGFAEIHALDGSTSTRLIRAGVDRDIVHVTGPIPEDPLPLPHDKNEMAVMAEALDTRPIWVAAQVTRDEVPKMAEAQILASRRNHRLILILIPRDPADGSEAARLLRQAGLSTGLRSEGDSPLEEHQAYVADLSDELGLWYRIAPLSFIGGTLSERDAISPYDPIVLGSAIIHGPKRHPQEARFTRLERRQAGREVRSATELGMAVTTLSSPEQSARMALAGWQELTRHAALFARLEATAIAASEGEVIT